MGEDYNKASNDTNKNKSIRDIGKISKKKRGDPPY